MLDLQMSKSCGSASRFRTLLAWATSAAAVAACSGSLGEPELLAGAPASASLTVLFSPKSGTFVDSQTVVLSVEDARAEVHYTLDGSVPSASSPIYVEELTLEASVRVRALAIVPEVGGVDGGIHRARRGAVASAAYLRLSEDAAQFTSHLPIVVVHTFESGELDPMSDEFVPATLMLFEPEAGNSALLGRASLDSRIGIHVRGETSRFFPKKQYSLEFRKDASSSDRDLPLLGMPADSDWVLSDPLAIDRTSVRNALVFALSNRIGRYAPRTRFVEAYLVDADGDVSQESFLGLYTLIERIKRGRDRVNVEKLDDHDATQSTVSGGFILCLDKGENHFDAGGKALQFVYPKPEAMAGAARNSQLDFIRGYIDGFAEAASAPGFRQPSSDRHYSEFIDVDSWIDHHILNMLAKNVDALRVSTYFHKSRAGRLVAGPVWDFDRSLGTPYDPHVRNPTEWKRAGSDDIDYFAEGWWGLLFKDPAFKERYRDRFLGLLEDEFAPLELERAVEELVSEVGVAADRNFARWLEHPPRHGSHDGEVALLVDFLRQRSTWIHEQLTNW